MSAQAQAPSLSRRLNWNWNWVGVVPFFLAVIAFLMYPALSIFIRSFTDEFGKLTLKNIIDLNQPIIVESYLRTIEASIITSIMGGAIGFCLAWGLTLGRLPEWIRNSVLTFSGVAANFAGVPLVFAFQSTLGVLGVVTVAFKNAGLALYPSFSLYSFLGLCLIYTYFQIPLMTLITIPALEGLRPEWQEAAANLGATRWQYWRHVALPILAPSILGSMTLLFANAFGTHATAYALIGGGGGANMIVSIMVGNQFSTDTFSNPALGNSLALGMIFIIAINIFIYTWMRRQSERWLPH